MAYTFPPDKKSLLHIPKSVKSPISGNRKLGSGSYGQVYEAHNNNNVVKCVDRYNCNYRHEDRSHELTSITEIAVLKSNLLNIPQLVNVEYDGKSIMLEMENCGMPLTHMSKRMTFEQRVAMFPYIAVQLLSSAYELQQCGIVHNDIKGSNVLMNKKYKVTLIDFGLCLFQTVDKAGKGLSIQPIFGTYTICPPEMFIEDKWVIDKLMPWSIGVTLCEFLYGTNNFMRSLMMDDNDRRMYDKYANNEQMLCNVIRNHFKKKIMKSEKAIALSNDGLPDDICNLISSLCAFDPEARLNIASALNLPMFNIYENKSFFNQHICTFVLSNKVDIAFNIFNTEIEHKTWRAECIEWLFDLYSFVNKMHLFVHAVCMFDRYSSKVPCYKNEYPLVMGACAYIVQYISRIQKIAATFITSQVADLTKKMKVPTIKHSELHKMVEKIINKIDDGFYRPTFDVMLVSSGISINPHKLVEVMTNIIPPYDNTIMFEHYNSY